MITDEPFMRACNCWIMSMFCIGGLTFVLYFITGECACSYPFELHGGYGLATFWYVLSFFCLFVCFLVSCFVPSSVSPFIYVFRRWVVRRSGFLAYQFCPSLQLLLMELSSLFPFQTFLLWISLVYITAKFTCMQSYKCLFTWILSVLICGFHCLLVYITPVLFAFMDWVNIFVWRLVSWSFLMQHVQLLNGFPMFSSFMEKVMVSWSTWRLKF